MSNTNGILLKHLFQLAEEDNVNKKIQEIFSDNIESIDFIGLKSIHIKFNNEIEVSVTYNLDMFHIDISDESLYNNGESKESPMGSDRVIWYLRNIALHRNESN